jgi:hypothetical protein
MSVSKLSLMILAGLAFGPVYAEEDRGSYSSFGTRFNSVPNLRLQTAPAAPPVVVTSYRVSHEKAEKFHVVDEEASVQFRLVGLPAGMAQSEYKVAWKFDEARQGSVRNMLEPEETAALTVRYNTANSNHRMVELRVSSVDGQWTGSTTFPVSGRDGDSRDIAEDNVLLVRMQPQTTNN